MATSDNVVRAGLTPKLRDVETLCSMLTYTYGPAENQVIEGTNWKESCKNTLLYDPPIDEFSILRTDLKEEDMSEIHPAIEGPSILIIIKGSISLKTKSSSAITASIGQTFFILPGEELTITSKSDDTLFFRAFVA